MATVKSSAENLTLNADGSGNDIKFQSNGVEKASIDQDGNLVLSGTLTSTGIDDNADATAITIDSNERVGIGITSPTNKLHVKSTGAEQINLETTGGATTILAIALKNSANTWQLENGRASDVFSVRSSTGGETIRSHSNGVTSFNSGIALGVGLNNTASNVLDDYEEGTWTPVVTNNGGSFSSQTANYTKIGRLVYIFCFIASSNMTYSSATDVFTITGVPFAENAQGYIGQPGSFYGKLHFNNTGSSSTTNSIITPAVSSTSIHFSIMESLDSGGGNNRIKNDNNGNYIVQVGAVYITNA